MDKVTKRCVQEGEAGLPVYISALRSGYASLYDDESFPLTIIVTLADGGQRCFPVRLPRFIVYPSREQRVVVNYFLAVMYNILSALGGREVHLVNPTNAPEATILLTMCKESFGIGMPRHERRGYGACLNVLERMNDAILSECECNAAGMFTFHLVESLPEPSQEETPRGSGALDVFASAATSLENRAIVGMDIGGTDIKLALAVNGQLVCCKEFDWFPTAFTSVEQFVDPIHVLLQIMGLAAAAASDAAVAKKVDALLAPALQRDAAIESMRQAIGQAGQAGVGKFLFDAIGLCFPDVVMDDKIVSGESPKTRGIRDAFGRLFEKEYVRLTNLNMELQRYVKPDGVVALMNDGSMAAFTTGVEIAVSKPDKVKDGVFAHTLGTDFGTGWIDETGSVPQVPLEIYNFIIDLGSQPAHAFEPDDVRSVNNINSQLSGTLQKYASQFGVFRLAAKYFPSEKPELFRAMLSAGYVSEYSSSGKPGLYVPTAPVDMRKPFLEYIMALAEEGDSVAQRIFREIGEALAVTCAEVEWILHPRVKERMLFGRLVKKPVCFALMREGAAPHGWTGLTVADDNLAETSLMQALSRSKDYTIAQFAQAIGAIHYGNYRLTEKHKQS